MSKNYKIRILLLLLITFIVYAFGLKNNFVKWDDFIYIVENNDVINFSPSKVWSFFTNSYNNTYIPLTMITWAIEYSLVGDTPFIYILNNILLHIACVYLVYLISLLLFKKENTALIIAAVFALHPAHVESVVWISERKDVLYAFFYFLALWFYIKDCQRKKDSRIYYIYALIFFTLSLFSKGQAVTFSLVILAVDYFLNKNWLNKKNIIEKIPFFMLSLIFGIIALYFQNYMKGSTVLYDFSLIERIQISSLALIKYILITLVPLSLSPVNPLPNPHMPLPHIYAISTIAIPLFLFIFMYSFKKNKMVFLGLAIYFFSIFIMLDHTRVGIVFFADRFLYVGLFGFSIIVAALFNFIENKLNKNAVITICILIFSLYGLKTAYQTQVWKSSESLFSYALKINNENPVALCNYANALSERKDFDNAIIYYNKSLNIFPQYIPAYNDRGVMYSDIKKFEKALHDFNTAIKYSPNEANFLVNRGNAYLRLNNNKLAKKDFEQALKNDNNNIAALLGMSLYHTRTKNYSLSTSYINKIKRINPNSHSLYFSIANNFIEQDEYQIALKNINKAIEIENEYGTYYRLRGEIKGRYMNDLEGAEIDLKKAIELDKYDYIAYNNLGIVNLFKGNELKATELFQKSIEILPNYCEALVNLVILSKKNNRESDFSHYSKIAKENNCKIPIF